jgi:uncharacterized RDD family membrane protein YckC
MSNWYYADRDRQRHGPMDGATLAQIFRDGRIGLDALVWRDGLPQWQPLGEMAGELGLLADAPPAVAAPSPGPAPVLDPAPAPTVTTSTDNRAVFTASEPAAQTWAASTATYSVPQDPGDRSPYSAPAAALTSHGDVVLGGEVVYAGFWKRVAAYMIDAFVLGVVTQIIQMVLMGIFMGASYTSLISNPEGLMSSASGIALILAIYLIPLAINLAYYAGMHSSSKQATLGKMAVGIKVVMDDGRQISLGRGIGRFFAALLSGLTLCIGYLMAAFTDRKQGLHDMICSTLVVDRWAFTDQPERQRRELGAVTIAILIIFGALILLGLALVGVVIAALASRGFGS